MKFDQSLISRIENLPLAIGNEKSLRETVEMYAAPAGFTVSQDSLGNTIARRGRGPGCTLAVFTPVSSRSFAVRYIDKNNVAYLHTEVENWEKWIDHEIVFPDGTDAVLEESPVGKITAKLRDDHKLMQGSSAQLKKTSRISEDGGRLCGEDLSNIANIYALLRFIKHVPREVNLEICFASQHKASSYHPGGMLLAARNMAGAPRLWLEAVAADAAGVFVETGDNNYLLSAGMQSRLEAVSQKPQKKVCVFGGAVSELIKEAGPDTMGIGIPIKTENSEETIAYKDLMDLTAFLIEFAGGTYARN